MMKKTVLLIAVLIFSGIAFADHVDSHSESKTPGFLDGFFTLVGETLEQIRVFISEVRQDSVSPSLTPKPLIGELASTMVRASPTDNAELIAIENMFNNFVLTQGDKSFLQKRFGNTFVIQANIVMEDGSITITHIIKDNDNVFVTSEGTDLLVNEELTIQFTTLKEITSKGGLTVIEGVGLILSGKIRMNPLFIPRLLDIQNLPSLRRNL